MLAAIKFYNMPIFLGSHSLADVSYECVALGANFLCFKKISAEGAPEKLDSEKGLFHSSGKHRGYIKDGDSSCIFNRLWFPNISAKTKRVCVELSHPLPIGFPCTSYLTREIEEDSFFVFGHKPAMSCSE